MSNYAEITGFLAFFNFLVPLLKPCMVSAVIRFVPF